MTELRERLYSKQHKQAHDFCLQLEQQSEENSELYAFMPLFLEMLASKNAFVRVRGFRLLCAQAKWDTDGLIDGHLPTILDALDDEKPTNVRQYLSVITRIIEQKPHLAGQIRLKLESLDLSKYKGSIQPLICKDIYSLLTLMEAAL